MQVDVSKASIIEIKAFIYDESLKMEQIRQTIIALENELQIRYEQTKKAGPLGPDVITQN